MEVLAPCALVPGLAALLGETGADPDRPGHAARSSAIAAAAAERLKLSRQEREALLWLVRRRDDVEPLPDLRPCAFKRLARSPLFPALLDLDRARRLARGRGLETHARIVAQLQAWTAEDLSPAPFVTGNDLLALGLSGGPEVGRLLTELEDAQLDGEIRSREEGLARAAQRTAEIRGRGA